MLNYGFFNSSNGDRKYNADSMNEFLEGLISPTGIFADVGDGFMVRSGEGLSVTIGTGKALINNHWVKNSAILTETLSASHQLLNRYDAIVLRLNLTNRDITCVQITGTPATTATKPSIVRSETVYDICLAYVYVAAGATAITQANIEDVRLNSDLCGFITGLVEQLDTAQFYVQLETWMINTITEFNRWYKALTEELEVNTKLQAYTTSYDGNGVDKVFALPAEYSDGDIIDVYLNNIVLMLTDDYTVSGSNIVLNNLITTGNKLTIRIIKNVISY